MQQAKEEVYKKTERSIDNQKFVTGITTINHKIRLALGITLREYTILDFICSWHQNHKEPVTYGKLWIGTGIRPRYIDRIFQRMKEKNLLFRDKDGKVKTTEIWNNMFNSGGVFIEIWKMHKVGNKAKAQSAFLKAIKVDTPENIKAGVIRYIDYLKATDQYPAHLSTFLNHKNKMWQDDFNADNYKKKSTGGPPEIKASTSPKSKL